MERHTPCTSPDTYSSELHHTMGSTASLALLFTGLSYLMLILVMPLIDQPWHFSQKMQGLLGLTALCGTLIGMFASAYWIRKVGQRSLLVISISGVLLCALFSVFTSTVSLFILTRFLLGMCISANYPVIMRYLRFKTKQHSTERFHADPLKNTKSFLPDVKFDPYISF